MKDNFNSLETNTSMPQNGNLPETTSLQNHTNDLAETNPQEDSNEEQLYNAPISDTTETDPNFISPGPRHSLPLRYRVSPKNVIDLGPI